MNFLILKFCIFSGESGSGKTFWAMHMLRQLFDLAGGGSETDAFKHLSATLTVLRSLCSAATVTNTESSRVVRSRTLVIHMYRSKSDTQ